MQSKEVAEGLLGSGHILNFKEVMKTTRVDVDVGDGVGNNNDNENMGDNDNEISISINYYNHGSYTYI